MGFNEPTTKTFNRNAKIGNMTVDQVLNLEFNSYHKSTFKYEGTGETVTVSGAAYLVNWLDYLVTQSMVSSIVDEVVEAV